MAAFSEVPPLAPMPRAPKAWQPPPPLPEQPLTPAGPGLLSCALHGVTRERTHFGRPMGCRHCEHDRAEHRSLEAATQHAAILRDRLLTACGLVGRYRAATFDNFEARTLPQRTVLKSCRQYAEGDDYAKGVAPWLLGPVGTGKSHMLAAIARHMRLVRCIDTLVITPRQIVRELRACWAKDATRTEEDVLEWLGEDTDVLLLDEAGLGFNTPAELLQVYEIVDRRYTRSLPTALASNLSADDLKAALGDRVFDRLREGARVLRCDWESHRGRA